MLYVVYIGLMGAQKNSYLLDIGRFEADDIVDAGSDARSGYKLEAGTPPAPEKWYVGVRDKQPLRCVVRRRDRMEIASLQ